VLSTGLRRFSILVLLLVAQFVAAQTRVQPNRDINWPAGCGPTVPIYEIGLNQCIQSTGVAANPAGGDEEVQFNKSNAFGVDAGFTYDYNAGGILHSPYLLLQYAASVGTTVQIADGVSMVNAVRFAGATADVKLAAAITYACAHGARALNAFGLSNLTIAATVSAGCSDGSQLEFYFDGSAPFVPSTTTTDMFLWLPGAVGYGELAADVTGSSGYSGKVFKLSGHIYDNQPGNLTSSKAVTIAPNIIIFGGGNATGYGVYLASVDGVDDYIQFVHFRQVIISGMLYGFYTFASDGGWTNSNYIERLRCSNTIDCLVNDTGGTGAFSAGNTIAVYENEFATNFGNTPQKGWWLKGTGDAENNSILSAQFWDWPEGMANKTLYADGTLEAFANNIITGQFEANEITDTLGAFWGFDGRTGKSIGSVNNPTGLASYNTFNAQSYGMGYSLAGDHVLSSDDGNNTILDPMTAGGSVFLRSGSGVYKARLNSTGTFSVNGMQTTQALINPFSSTITGGILFDGYQDTSTFNGTVFYADVAHGSGSFSGLFAQFLKNTVSQFSVDAFGDVFSLGYANFTLGYKVNGTTVIDSSQNGDLLSLNINGAAFADSSRNVFATAVKIGSSYFAPVVEQATLNQIVCIKSLGPPIQHGTCSSALSGTPPTCTCN
jgi:hypothetical protein